MVDPGKVRSLLEALEGYRSRLVAMKELPLESYLRDQAMAGRYLVLAAAQTCIDLAHHIIASEGWRAPRDFRDAFTVLGEQAVLSPDLTERLRALAGLRNRLVHLYADVDDALVHSALGEGLDDLDAFSRAVARLLGDR